MKIRKLIPLLLALIMMLGLSIPSAFAYGDLPDWLLGTHYHTEIRVDENGIASVVIVPDTESTPSVWAREEVEAAAYLVPESISTNFKARATLTRAQFCDLIISGLNKITSEWYNMTLDEALTACGVTVRNPFTDTTSKAVAQAYSLGIINGVSPTQFNPSGLLTREQGATMLARAVTTFFDGPLYQDEPGVWGDPNQESWLNQTTMEELNQWLTDIGEEVSIYNDMGSVASWAKVSVQYIRYINDPFNGPIMGGTGSNTFSPQDTLTCEQGIIAVGRMVGAAFG